MENVVLDGKVLFNDREVLACIQKARKELQGTDYRISSDAHRWAVHQQYVQAMPKHEAQPLTTSSPNTCGVYRRTRPEVGSRSMTLMC